MNTLDDDIRKALANGESIYDLEKEAGIFRQWAGIFHGKMRWMAIFATIEAVVFTVLIVLAIIEFFQTDDTKWQIFYATGVLLLAILLLLVKLWGWMQMNRYAIQREIKRLELRILELGEQKQE
jgi:protein-S-isoprenylcysteine O-methyltransferase Ste14